MKPAAAAIGELPAEEVARLRAGEELELEVAGETVALGPDDVEVHVEVLAEFDVEADGKLVVYLDTELDDALLAEGLAREVVNRVNGLRKDRGLAVEERIRLCLDGGDSELLARALREHGPWIQGETLATELQLGPEPFEGAEPASWDLGEGHVLTASLVPA